MMRFKSLRPFWVIFLSLNLLFPVLGIGQGKDADPAIAFPGAEGGGMYATGGRGGIVIAVNTLEDSGLPGSFRYAIEQKGKRTIVFNVDGTIFLKTPLAIKNGDLTVAGQSAPGDGICIANYPVTVEGNNIVIRYLRFRMGDSAAKNADGADAFSGRQTKNVIIDHCSISWSTDECSSFYDNENFTMQWCIISESLRLSGHSKGAHGYGAIWGGVNATFHHNLLAHHDSRTPRFGPGMKFAGKDRVDVRNNVFYNWNGNGCYGGEAMSINIVNNYYKPGPGTSKKIAGRVMAINAKNGSDSFKVIAGVWGKYFISGNTILGNQEVSKNNWLGVSIDGNNQANIELQTPVESFPLKSFTASCAYEQVLAYAGCSKVRDEVDARIISETRNGTAAFIGKSPSNGVGKSVGYPRAGLIDSQTDLKPMNAGTNWSPWPVLASKPSALDADHDGMPDDWELAHHLSPNVANATGRNLSKTYDNLEFYLNELVAQKGIQVCQ